MSRQESIRAKGYLNLLHEMIIIAEDTISVNFKSEALMNDPVFNSGQPYPAGKTKYMLEIILADPDKKECSGD